MRDLKPDTGTVTAAELPKLFQDFDVKLPEEIEFPFGVKLSKQHSLMIDRRTSQRMTTDGIVDLYNWHVTENMRNDVRRE